jgi:AcrR family transcriptional regulator
MTAPMENSIRPTRQSRSRNTRDRLLQAGRQLIEEHGYDDIAIQDIAARSGCSIGAFYHHFATKEAFYVALVQRSVQEVRNALGTTLTGERLDTCPTAAIVHAAVRFVAQAFRERQGLVRAVLKKAMDDPDAWNPIRELGCDITAQVTGLLVTEAPDSPDHGARFAVAVAMQIIYSTLLNAVINRPGPLLIEDDAIVLQLTHIAVGYLQAPLLLHKS